MFDLAPGGVPTDNYDPAVVDAATAARHHDRHHVTDVALPVLVLPTPGPTVPFRALCVVGPSGTDDLRELHQRVLPLARSAGFARLQLHQCYDGLDTRLTAYAGYAIGNDWVTLAQQWDCNTLPELETQLRAKLTELAVAPYAAI